MNSKFISAIVSAFIVSGCASTPQPNPALETARTGVQTAEADPNVARYSPLDLDSAKAQLQVAETAYMNHDTADVDQPAYMAAQMARLAQLKAAAKADDARVAAGQKEREQIALDARTREVSQQNAAAQAAAAKAAALQAEFDALKAKRNQQ